MIQSLHRTLGATRGPSEPVAAFYATDNGRDDLPCKRDTSGTSVAVCSKPHPSYLGHHSRPPLPFPVLFFSLRRSFPLFPCRFCLAPTFVLERTRDRYKATLIQFTVASRSTSRRRISSRLIEFRASAGGEAASPTTGRVETRGS